MYDIPEERRRNHKMNTSQTYHALIFEQFSYQKFQTLQLSEGFLATIPETPDSSATLLRDPDPKTPEIIGTAWYRAMTDPNSGANQLNWWPPKIHMFSLGFMGVTIFFRHVHMRVFG